jgi:hypothetical protein
MALDLQEPSVAAAIKSGGDPNNGTAQGGDAASSAVAMGINGDPVPYYGCAIRPPTHAHVGEGQLGALAALLAVRRRRRG